MQPNADQQVEAAIAAERESLSPECRADPERISALLAPDFHEFGASGGELEFADTPARVAAAARSDARPIKVERMRGQWLADGLVMLKYTSCNAGRWSNRTSLWRRTADDGWQLFHHQGTLTAAASPARR